MKTRNVLMFTASVVLPIVIGIAIYVGWRTTSLVVFEWMVFLGIPDDIFRPALDLPPTILYSLPDGCWVPAGTSWMLLIWQRIHPWVLVFVAIAMGGEFGQGVHLVPGTFDWTDVAFYLGGFVLALLGYKHAQTLFINGRTVGDAGPCCR